MVSERKASWELIQKARDLWPPKFETIIEFLTNAERISSKNNHLIYSYKATLFHGLEKFDEAIKYWELYMKCQDNKFHPQTKSNIKKAEKQQKIDYVYPWEDQLNYFNLKKSNNNSSILIYDEEFIKNIMKITRIDKTKTLKRLEISLEEFIENARSCNIDEMERQNWTWIQRIWNHRRIEFERNGIQYSGFTSKNLIKNIPKIFLIMACIEIDFIQMFLQVFIKSAERFQNELIKIEKLLDETNESEQERIKLLKFKYNSIKNFMRVKKFEEEDFGGILEPKLRWEHPCEIIINLQPIIEIPLNYKWFIIFDDKFDVNTTTDEGYEKLKKNLKGNLGENIDNFLNCMDEKNEFKNINEFKKFIEKSGFMYVKNNPK